MKKSTEQPLRTSIECEGQPYVDEPVYRVVSEAKPLVMSINAACSAMDGRRVLIAPQIRDLTHYNRVPLRWMKPDGRGELVPR